MILIVNFLSLSKKKVKNKAISFLVSIYTTLSMPGGRHLKSCLGAGLVRAGPGRLRRFGARDASGPGSVVPFHPRSTSRTVHLF